MTGSPESAFAERTGRGGLVLVAPSWIGDTVMCLPALQAWRAAHAREPLAVLAKASLKAFWSLHAAPDAFLPLQLGLRGSLATARALRERSPARAAILPHSFRSAFVPFLAGVPERRGPPGHARDFLLTAVAPAPAGPARRHQAWEAFPVLELPPPPALPAPELALPEAELAAARRRAAAGAAGYAVLLPGAARGPSKRWPAAHFAAVGRRLLREAGLAVLVLGAAGEAGLCAEVAAAAGTGARSLAGQTTLTEWAALLRCARLVVTNDSGGMHLAAAVGTPLVAVFGATDPDRTGPLGGRCSIVQAEGPRGRDIARSDPRAEAALAAIAPEIVYEQVRRRLGEGCAGDRELDSHA